MQRILFVLGILLSFSMFCACSDSDDRGVDGCFSARITGARDDADKVKAVITQVPETLDDYDSQPPIYVGISIYLLKSDLSSKSFQIGDIVDFEIIRYEMIPLPEDRPMNTSPDYFCRVKPCK